MANEIGESTLWREGERAEMTLERGQPGYPSRLEMLADPPTRLYVRGQIPDEPMIAVVGSRAADAAARRFAHGLAADLARRGLAIVSGGALGVDTAAHEGALAGGGRTVAVIGSGFDYMYPEPNRHLFERISGNGALMSEFDPATPPARWTFPRRNRLVAAMARAVIVVQAGERSGALITARLAREIGVPVGAVPGSPADPRGRGCNRLLREGAALIEEADDVAALVESPPARPQFDLPGMANRRAVVRQSVQGGLSGTEIRILDLLGPRPMHIDDIAANVGLSAGEAGSAMLTLEVAGLVEDQGGKNFVRVG